MVTGGGCGFIGLKFAKQLLDKKHSVYLMGVDENKGVYQ